MKHALHNTLSRSQLAEELAKEAFTRINVSFYRYTRLENPDDFRDQLYAAFSTLKIFGRVYVAQEGVNAQLSVPELNWQKFAEVVESFSQLQGLLLNRSLDQSPGAFIKLDIKVRPKIVADGLDDKLFEQSQPTTHLLPEQFDEKLAEENTLVVDVRNNYECETGHFEGALCPDSKYFRDVLPELKDKLDKHRDKDLLLYCTGGIRCEKASAYLNQQGYSNVYQLKGGIVNYLNSTVGEGKPSKFEGSMFVFDGRMAEQSHDKVISKCYQCDSPHDVHKDCANVECHKLFIQCDNCSQKYDGCCSQACHEYLQEKVRVG